jgi:hypothetical protein
MFISPYYYVESLHSTSFGQRLDTIKMCHSTYFPNVCVSVIFTYCQNGSETNGVGFYYLETDGVEFDTYWQNGGYKKFSYIIFAEWHIFIVSNLWFGGVLTQIYRLYSNSYVRDLKER